MTAVRAIHTGLRQLGIVEDDKRDLYERVTGKRSLTDMTPRQQDAVVDELRRLGFKAVSKDAHTRAEGKYAKILQALWIGCWNLGLTNDRTDAALTAFVRRQTKVDHTRFLRHHEDATKVIEALKGWMAREGGVVWSTDKLAPAWQRRPGAKVAMAQWAMLAKLGVPCIPATFREFVEARVFNPITHMSPTEWALVMNQFGDTIRQRRAAP